ncbi:MAG: disulfide bond formation protein B [Candidatus Buchananbacteria bacterium]|nr:disulfide bond formation protein B [Candidatus Buchananbacteria bacterium]
MVAFVNQLLAILTVLADIFLLLVILLFILSLISKKIANSQVVKMTVKLVGQNYFWGAFLVATLATGGSLFYSEIAGYDPCKLCWFQRIFMYPQSLLLLVAWIKKDNQIIKYSLSLSLVGGLIAFYHYLLQLGLISSGLSCSTVGYSVSCSQRFVLQFGYVTIVSMSLTAFCLLISLNLVRKVYLKSQD